MYRPDKGAVGYNGSANGITARTLARTGAVTHRRKNGIATNYWTSDRRNNVRRCGRVRYRLWTRNASRDRAISGNSG